MTPEELEKARNWHKQQAITLQQSAAVAYKRSQTAKTHQAKVALQHHCAWWAAGALLQLEWLLENKD